MGWHQEKKGTETEATDFKAVRTTTGSSSSFLMKGKEVRSLFQVKERKREEKDNSFN